MCTPRLDPDSDKPPVQSHFWQRKRKSDCRLGCVGKLFIVSDAMMVFFKKKFERSWCVFPGEMIEYDIWDLLFHVTVMTSDPAGEAGARAWWQWPRLDGPQRVTECWCCHVSLWARGLLSQASVNHIFVDLWFLVGTWRWHHVSCWVRCVALRGSEPASPTQAQAGVGPQRPSVPLTPSCPAFPLETGKA